MTRNRVGAAALSIAIFIMQACARQTAVDHEDTPSSGMINISADESFRPVIEEQIRVYESSFPNAHIVASYKSEADCLKDFFTDTLNRMIIVTRGLLEKEDKYLFDSLGYHPGWNAVATDAVAIIVNAKSNDTLFTKQRLREQLTGRLHREQTMVFDGLNATSTIRYISDSILKGNKFDSSVVRATKTSQEVIKYVAEHDNAVGFVGISWIGNPEDSAQVKMLEKVKIAYVQCAWCEGMPFVKPIQESILSKRYPLVRGLYYALKENYRGLGSGFIDFLKYERGQLIFKRAYLGPLMQFNIRDVRLNEKLPSK